jgi:pyruvate dehydrogenase E2 component (dihydrolipoamide acetyltransferase)/2-oxoglutarate dehydrogenase E2 component (dihydrolipoamide succinyltransferase)
MTMEEATIAEWKANDGDMVEKDQIVLVIDTEKVAHEMESPASGFLVILAEPGQVHPCGAVVGKLAETKEEYDAIKKIGVTVEVKRVEVTESEAEQAAAANPAAVAPEPEAPKPAGRIFISPVAKRIAEMKQVDISKILGSGPNGRIVKKDVEKALETGPAAEVPAAASQAKAVDLKATFNGKRIKEIIPLRGMRKTIAERMHHSSTVAARVTAMTEYDLTEMIKIRKYFNEKAGASGVKLTFTDMFILIVAKALKAAPILNASLVGDEIRVWEDINIGFAVAMMVSEKESGLVVPVIKNADQKGLVEIARVRKDLTDKAREGKLTMDEMTGGTFTITNTGPIAKTWHIQTPIINQPESAILGTSAIVEKPVVKNGEIVISSVMPISFSYDHRIVDGGPVAAFMTKLTELVEDPKMLIL